MEHSQFLTYTLSITNHCTCFIKNIFAFWGTCKVYEKPIIKNTPLNFIKTPGVFLDLAINIDITF